MSGHTVTRLENGNRYTLKEKVTAQPMAHVPQPLSVMSRDETSVWKPYLFQPRIRGEGTIKGKRNTTSKIKEILGYVTVWENNKAEAQSDGHATNGNPYENSPVSLGTGTTPIGYFNCNSALGISAFVKNGNQYRWRLSRKNSERPVEGEPPEEEEDDDEDDVVDDEELEEENGGTTTPR